MKRSLRCVLEEWGSLLVAVRAGEADFPALTAHRVALEGHLENVKAARARQLALKENYRQATREVLERVHAGSDDVRRLRSQVRAELGPRDARLRLFGIKPLDGGSRWQGCLSRALAPV